MARPKNYEEYRQDWNKMFSMNNLRDGMPHDEEIKVVALHNLARSLLDELSERQETGEKQDLWAIHNTLQKVKEIYENEFKEAEEYGTTHSRMITEHEIVMNRLNAQIEQIGWQIADSVSLNKSERNEKPMNEKDYAPSTEEFGEEMYEAQQEFERSIQIDKEVELFKELYKERSGESDDFMVENHITANYYENGELQLDKLRQETQNLLEGRTEAALQEANYLGVSSPTWEAHESAVEYVPFRQSLQELGELERLHGNIEQSNIIKNFLAATQDIDSINVDEYNELSKKMWAMFDYSYNNLSNSEQEISKEDYLKVVNSYMENKKTYEFDMTTKVTGKIELDPVIAPDPDGSYDEALEKLWDEADFGVLEKAEVEKEHERSLEVSGYFTVTVNAPSVEEAEKLAEQAYDSADFRELSDIEHGDWKAENLTAVREEMKAKANETVEKPHKKTIEEIYAEQNIDFRVYATEDNNIAYQTCLPSSVVNGGLITDVGVEWSDKLTIVEPNGIDIVDVGVEISEANLGDVKISTGLAYDADAKAHWSNAFHISTEDAIGMRESDFVRIESDILPAIDRAIKESSLEGDLVEKYYNSSSLHELAINAAELVSSFAEGEAKDKFAEQSDMLNRLDNWYEDKSRPDFNYNGKLITFKLNDDKYIISASLKDEPFSETNFNATKNGGEIWDFGVNFNGHCNTVVDFYDKVMTAYINGSPEIEVLEVSVPLQNIKASIEKEWDDMRKEGNYPDGVNPDYIDFNLGEIMPLHFASDKNIGYANEDGYCVMLNADRSILTDVEEFYLETIDRNVEQGATILYDVNKPITAEEQLNNTPKGRNNMENEVKAPETENKNNNLAYINKSTQELAEQNPAVKDMADKLLAKAQELADTVANSKDSYGNSLKTFTKGEDGKSFPNKFVVDIRPATQYNYDTKQKEALQHRDGSPIMSATINHTVGNTTLSIAAKEDMSNGVKLSHIHAEEWNRSGDKPVKVASADMQNIASNDKLNYYARMVAQRVLDTGEIPYTLDKKDIDKLPDKAKTDLMRFAVTAQQHFDKEENKADEAVMKYVPNTDKYHEAVRFYSNTEENKGLVVEVGKTNDDNRYIKATNFNVKDEGGKPASAYINSFDISKEENKAFKDIIESIPKSIAEAAATYKGIDSPEKESPAKEDKKAVKNKADDMSR